ncbi:hypothetical protein BTR23_03755 [Alkalihalophilus pseudofirmus]|nr:hypothetical protein BTR23_03755 [Alkalihalophilus pseudofirmus]
MLFLKPREVSKELKLLRYIKNRMPLSIKEANFYNNLEKGFEGEQKFDKWLELLSCDCLILNDLLFECNNTVFQIDSLLISPETIYLFEVKNYEGDYYIEAKRWYKVGKKIEKKDPLLQLKRSETLLHQILEELRFNTSIESYLIFINPHFYLYQAPLNLPIVFLGQLNRFMNKLNSSSSKLKDSHLQLAQQLILRHLQESPYERKLQYNYEQLKKGVICPSCYSFIINCNEQQLECDACGCNEVVTAAILRSIEEYRALFPERKITTNAIYEWCSSIRSKRTIQRILSTNYKHIGHGKSAHYVDITSAYDGDED